jgi:glycosyltransferase involved in cell wall biosynthesis
MKPTILIITALGPPPYLGGIENVVDTLLNSGLTQSYSFSIFDTYRSPDPNRTILTKILFGLALPFRCARHIISVRPALAHIHFCSKTDFWKHALCLFTCKVLKVKTIFHLHGGSFDQFYTHANGPQKAAIRFILRRPDILIALSQYWHDFLSELAPDSTIRILPNPIDSTTLGSFSTRESIKNHSVVLLGCLGKRKGHFDVLKAMPMVLTKFPDTQLYFAGVDENLGATEQLRELARENNFSNNVHFLGPVSGQDKLKLLGEAGIIILPSYGENMPISVLEGMAAGKPVITTKVGAVPEVITDNENGILIDPGDWQALAEKINYLFDHSDFALHLGTQAKNKVEKNFDISIIANKVSNLYQEMLQPVH